MTKPSSLEEIISYSWYHTLWQLTFSTLMIIGVCQLHLHLYEAASLKEKRRIVRSLIERTKARFNVAVAEVDLQDVWGTAVIGISCLSTDTRHANQLLDAVIRFIGDLPLEMEIMDCSVSYLSYP